MKCSSDESTYFHHLEKVTKMLDFVDSFVQIFFSQSPFYQNKYFWAVEEPSFDIVLLHM